jgi:hypothetical protein
LKRVSSRFGSMPSARILAAAIALAVGLASTGCGDEGDDSAYEAKRASIPSTGAPPWPAPPDPLRRTREAGLRPERREQLAYHVHSHLDVFVNGRPVTVPAGIGINTTDPGVKSGRDKNGGLFYGGIELCAHPCISPLHTHDTSGILHTESPTPTPNRLGQFFIEWGVRLDRSCVGGFCRPRAPIAFFVDGERYTKDPRAIGLADHREIAIVIGSPPARIPVRGDFSEA